MANYLITYDLHDKSHENELLTYLKTIGAKKVTASSYRVEKSDASADELLKEVLSITKKLAVHVLRLSSKSDHASHP